MTEIHEERRQRGGGQREWAERAQSISQEEHNHNHMQMQIQAARVMRSRRSCWTRSGRRAARACRRARCCWWALGSGWAPRASPAAAATSSRPRPRDPRRSTRRSLRRGPARNKKHTHTFAPNIWWHNRLVKHLNHWFYSLTDAPRTLYAWSAQYSIV